MTKFFAQWPSGRSVIFRSLSWAEFQKFSHELTYRNPAVVHLDVYRVVMLEGPSIHEVTAGIVEFVGRSLLEQNPFNGQYEHVHRALEIKRGELRSDYLLAAKAVIASLFHVSMDEIHSWDAEKFFEYVAMAEFVSGRTLEPANPNAVPAQAKGAGKRPLTGRQQATYDRVRERDQTPPPQTPPEDPAPRLRRPMTNAQQMVADRVRRQS